jgi:hypothetical protein
VKNVAWLLLGKSAIFCMFGIRIMFHVEQLNSVKLSCAQSKSH